MHAPVRRLMDVKIPMRDGVKLSADLYVPASGLAGGPYPTLLARTPYGPYPLRYAVQARAFAESGYMAIVQDVRGRHDSDGEWLPYRNDGRDGYDSIEWIAAQSWSNGRIGTWGGSYLGFVQWAAARERPPHLVTMVSTAAAGRWMEELPYMNGVLHLSHIQWLNLIGGRTNQDATGIEWQQVLRSLPLRTLPRLVGRDMPLWQEWLDHPRLDDYWRQIRLSDDDFARIDLPVLHITGWYDADQPGALFFHEGMQSQSPAADKQTLVIGPWDHRGTGENRPRLDCVEFGDAAVLDTTKLHIDWFDRWLGPQRPASRSAEVRFFMTGENRWSQSTAWPPPNARITRWFLAGSSGRWGALTSREPAPGDISFRYDPADPVRTDVGPEPQPLSLETTPSDRPMELGFIEKRSDVLAYTSEPLVEAVAAVGRPRLVIQASSNCPDTDWSVWLTDVGPSGSSIYVANGILRARYRKSLEREELLTPGEKYQFEVPLSHIGHVFAPGHRLRVLLSSSAFPMYDRNPNTGHPIGADAELRVARNTVFHGEGQASYLELARL